MKEPPKSRLSAVLLGMTVGDALGLPYESLSPRRGARLFGKPDRYRFLFGRGMISDDTEHACLTAQAIIASGGAPDQFVRQIGKRMRWWFAGISPGLGRATLKSCMRLWLGVSPYRSGVNSAGNGGVMRSVVLGAAFPNDLERLKELVDYSTRVTHRNMKAELGAWIISLATSYAISNKELTPAGFRTVMQANVDWGEQDKFQQAMQDALTSVERGESTVEFASSFCGKRGATGYILHTTPVAIHAWLRHQDNFRLGLDETIRCGGDTDTIASVVGGLIAASHGIECIPREWLDGIWEWPRTVDWIAKLGNQLDDAIQSRVAQRPLKLPWWGLLPRNLFFLAVVMMHIIRRALPPY